MTLFRKEGGAPAGGGQLAVRAESGDPEVTTSFVKDALYVATGGDPHSLLAIACESIAAPTSTSNTRFIQRDSAAGERKPTLPCPRTNLP